MEQIDRQRWGVLKEDVSQHQKLSKENYRLLCRLHAKYFNHKYYEPCSCRPKELKRWIADIDRIYDKEN
jgi:hypothetical protein